jgi:bacillithiol biosynthesis cysteine-adding enzyme BshC
VARAIDVGLLPWTSRLAADYAAASERLAPFYAGHPTSPDAWRDAITRTRAHPRDRAVVVEALLRQQARREAPPAARQAAERLLDPQTVAVVTGQQAGLLGGPVFTLLKALTALRHAHLLETTFGTPAVAVFWIDAEDHDWDEVASATVLDAESQVRTLRLPSPPNANHVPVARVHLDAAVEGLLQDLRATLPPTEFTDDLLTRVGAAYRPGAGMSDAFGRWLEDVLGPFGLVLYDCADLTTKPLAAAIFEHELAHPGRTWALASEAGSALEALGYHAQVAPHPDGVALFSLNGTRAPIRREGSQFVVGHERFEGPEFVRLARQHPERFSPNVLLRPLVQDALFPTVAYISGPSELAYLGQLKDVYAHFGIPMPLVVTRATTTLLDAAALRFIDRYAVPIPQLQPQDEAGLNRLLEHLLPPEVEGSLVATQRAVEEHMATVIQTLPTIDPTLEGAARSVLGRMEHDLRGLHTKLIHAAKKRDDTLRRQFVRTRALVFPHGHLQERTLGFVWFLNRYGPALIDILARDLPGDGRVHALLTP